MPAISSIGATNATRASRVSRNCGEYWFRSSDRLLEDILLHDGELIGLAAFFQLASFRKQIESPAELQMYAAKCCRVCGVSKVAGNVERFFYAEPPLALLGSHIPSLFFPREQLALTYRYNALVVIELIRIGPEKMEQQLADSLVIC